MGWYPLSKISLPPHVVAFQEDWFAYSIPPEALRELLKQHDIQRVWELRQGNVPYQYELDVEWFVPWQNSVESCWVSESLDWIIYTSHECSITFGGEWLLAWVKSVWSGWKEHLYTGYRFALPPLWEK